MTVLFSISSLLALAFAGALEPPEQGAGQRRVVTSTLTIQRVIIRVPNMATMTTSASASNAPRAPTLPPITWVERRAGRCVPLADVAAAAITRTDSVDLVLNGGKRVRARLGADCPALNFYAGVYLKPAADGKICAERDLVRSRSGGQCPIASFHALVPSR